MRTYVSLLRDRLANGSPRLLPKGLFHATRVSRSIVYGLCARYWVLLTYVRSGLAWHGSSLSMRINWRDAICKSAKFLTWRSAGERSPGRRWWSGIVPSDGASVSRFSRDRIAYEYPVFARWRCEHMSRFCEVALKTYLLLLRDRLANGSPRLLPKGLFHATRVSRSIVYGLCARYWILLTYVRSGLAWHGSVLSLRINWWDAICTSAKFSTWRSAGERSPGRRWWSGIVPSVGASVSRFSLDRIAYECPALREIALRTSISLYARSHWDVKRFDVAQCRGTFAWEAFVEWDSPLGRSLGLPFFVRSDCI